MDYATGPGPNGLAVLDANGDLQVDLGDVIRILSFLFGRGPGHVLGTGCVPIEGCADTCLPP